MNTSPADMALMHTELAGLARRTLAFDAAMDRLCREAERVGIPSPQHTDWYTLLKQKLIPQLNEQGMIVVAVTGGTNTGKSLLFNQLVGENASGVDARAAGTKHPVCLLPALAESEIDTTLHRYFEPFTTISWNTPEQPTTSSNDHRLYWRTGKSVPERLMLLDTPDIDSDTQVNWDRAMMIRQSADLLLVVLTAQKYNDAAVRRFFREAAAAGKATILLWNMVDLENDAAMLVPWTERFIAETGTKPLAVYVVPHDREAAALLGLPIYRLRIEDTESAVDVTEPVTLATMLSGLHFETVRVRALLGAIERMSNPDIGVPAYLEEVRQASDEFARARQALERLDATSTDWPDLPTAVLVEEIRRWWHESRPAWAQTVHGTYRTIGNGLLWPFRQGIAYFTGTPSGDPLDRYQREEYDTVTRIVEQSIERLEKLAETSNPVLKRELHDLLGGENRRKLFEQAQEVHLKLDPIDDGFRAYLHRALEEWTRQNPTAHTVFRSLDHVAAVARPVVTVTLLAGGFFGASQLLGHAGIQVAEVAIAGGVTAGGEAVAHSAGEGLMQSAARLFRNLRLEFVRNRAAHFEDWFYRELFRPTVDRLNDGAAIADSETFHAVESTLNAIRRAGC